MNDINNLYSTNDNPLDDAELLSISQASRNDESGVHQLSINFVQLELQPMIEAQRVNRHDEQGKSDASDPTVVESYIGHNANTREKRIQHDTVSTAQDNLLSIPAGGTISPLNIDVLKKLKDSELRNLITNAAKELKNRRTDEPITSSKSRRRSSSSPKIHPVSARTQGGSSRDFHNYEIDDPEVGSYNSKDDQRQNYQSRSGAIPPLRFSDLADNDEILNTFSPVSPVATSPYNVKKKPKHVPSVKVASHSAQMKEVALVSSPSLLLSPRSAFDDCSVGSSLSESTSRSNNLQRKL